MSKYGTIRAVVIQMGEDKQRAAIYTNATAEEIGGSRIVELMCHRWSEGECHQKNCCTASDHYTPGYVMRTGSATAGDQILK